MSAATGPTTTTGATPGNEDFNGPHQDGVGHYQVTQRDGRRWSAADAYLRPAMARPNLTVETGALVTQVLLAGGRATGVRYLRDGAPGEARAAREVVVAAGAVKTPQLLLLVLTGWRTPGTRNLWEEATPENLELWRRERRGPMASFGAEAGGFARTGRGRPAPDLQLGAIPGPPPLPELAPPTQRAVGTLVGAVQVRSRGRVSLASADPAARPLVDPAHFADEADLEVLVAGVRMAREIAACRPLAGLTAGELTPGAEVDDDERLRDWVRATSGTMFHPTGTCAMGGTAEAACDPQLRARGVAGLRVVDASVMPATRGATPTPPPSPWPSAPPTSSGATPPRRRGPGGPARVLVLRPSVVKAG